MLELAVFLKKYKKQCILGPLFKFSEVIFELLLPTILALIINNGVGRGDGGYVVRMGLVMAGLACLGFGCAAVCQRYAAQASQGFGTDLRNALFAKILTFSFPQMDRYGAPTLTTRLTNDVNQLQVWVAMMIRLVSRAPFILLGSILMAFLLDARLALLLVAATPLLAAIIFFITKAAGPLYRAYQGRLDRLSNVLREHLAGVRVIRAFTKNTQEKERFAAVNGELMGNGFAIGTVSALFNPLTSLVVNGLIVLILWVGGGRVQAGGLSQGQIIAFINYASQILAALLVLSNLIILLTKSMASAARVNEVLHEPVEATEAAGTATPSVPITNAPAIEFRDVSFGYHIGGDLALENLSFSIARGETVGIIGGTGAGKTTLGQLIPRFYPVTSGTLLVDGVPVEEYAADALRRKIGIVFQKATLFGGTVAENIRWAGEADDDGVRTAAATAQADEFIATLPQGYDSPVERGGVNLSGGQRQRLTIARALAAQAEILILDDASSALDYLTDARLRTAIRRMEGTRTVLLLSQRVSVVRGADRILVLEDGKLAGVGTHDELLRTCEAYREICASQQVGEEARA